MATGLRDCSNSGVNRYQNQTTTGQKEAIIMTSQQQGPITEAEMFSLLLPPKAHGNNDGDRAQVFSHREEGAQAAEAIENIAEDEAHARAKMREEFLAKMSDPDYANTFCPEAYERFGEAQFFPVFTVTVDESDADDIALVPVEDAAKEAK